MFKSGTKSSKKQDKNLRFFNIKNQITRVTKLVNRKSDHSKRKWVQILKYTKHNSRKPKRTEIFPGVETRSFEKHNEPILSRRHIQKNIDETKLLKLDRRTKQTFQQLKKLQIPCLAYYNSKSKKIMTTDKRTKELGSTLQQNLEEGRLKPIGIGSRL